MKKAIKYKALSILFFFLLPFTVPAETIDYGDLPDSSRLRIRLKSFLLLQPGKEFPEFLYSSGKNVPVAFIYEVNNEKELIDKIKICSSFQSQIIIISKNKLQIPDIRGTEIIICDPDKFDNVVCSCDTTSPPVYDSFLSENELLKFTLSKKNCKDVCFNFWKKTGKLPNFISSEPSETDEAADVVSFLNVTEKIYGASFENGQLLKEVYWKNNPGAVTYGHFCFPIIGYDYYLIPYKAGYRFSPGIIIQSESNKNDLKIFRGIKHEPDFGLTNHFTFNKKIKNEKWDNNRGIIVTNVKFRKDKKFGGVACFKNRAYIDAGPQSTEILDSDFSIVAWVRYNNPAGKNGILGKGKEFNFAIYQGELTFSMADIKDYISEKSPVPVDIWTQVAMVYSKFNNRIDFYLNGKQTDQINLISNYEGSDYTLLIGNNLWEEFFIGEMGEIKVWDRELSKDEIAYHYLHPGKQKNYRFAGLFFLIILAAGTVAYLIYKNKKQLKKSAGLIKKRPVKIISPGIMPKGEKIICFGGLKVFDSDDNEISIKFSPKLRQIFTLVLLCSNEKNNGITSRQLAETLWPGMSAANAKNIRSTYVQNLRSALSSFKNIRLVFSDKKWYFEFGKNLYNEYSEIENILDQLFEEKDSKLLETHLPSVISILKKGRFLAGMEESWLDPFIEKMNNRIIEFCLKMFTVLDDTLHSVLISDLTDIISYADPLNEPALHKKINLLIRQGKLSLAKNIYDNFVKLYKELYQEDYPTEFKDLAIP